MIRIIDAAHHPEQGLDGSDYSFSVADLTSRRNLGTISQVVPVTSSAMYRLSYALYNTGSAVDNGTRTNIWVTSVGTTTLDQLSGIPASGQWMIKTFSVIIPAGTNTTTISFRFRNVSHAVHASRDLLRRRHLQMDPVDGLRIGRFSVCGTCMDTVF
jgi:hypothetical protein